MKCIILLILLTIPIPASSATTINTSRPRVWIDGAIKTRLQADATANTREWQAMKTYCDSNLASNNGGVYKTSGYHYNYWYELVMSYGLCFQATGDQAYGNEGVVYMTGLMRDGADSGVIGDGLGGDTGIAKDSGYVTRSAGTGVAIGRDWLDGASGLTTAIINEAATRMGVWWTWVSANAHAIEDPRDNYYYGHFAMLYTSAFSFYGDTNYQSSWLTDAETKWSDEVLPIIENGYYDGGDWSKGWNYAPWATQELVGYLLARDTATDDAAPWSVTDIYEDLAHSQIHFLYPNRGQFSDNGMWSADIKGDPRSTLSRFLAAMTPIDATRKGTLKWYIDNLTYEPYSSKAWQKFFYKISNIAPIIPTSSNMGALAYETNIGHLIARSDNWANTNASLIELFSYVDRKPINNSTTNGDYNVGDMRFFSRGVSLIADGDRQQFTGHYQNQLFVTGTHTYAPYQEPWLYGKSGVSGYPEVTMLTGYSAEYAYGKINNLQNAYDGTYWTNSPSLRHYDRSVLAIWPDTVIVYDNAISMSTSNDVSVRWWFPRLPTIAGQTLTTTDASADMKLTVLGISGSFDQPGTSQDLAALTGTTTYRDGYYYADFQTTGTPTNNQIFTIMQAGDNGFTAIAPALITGTGGRGALIGSTVAMFTDSELGSDISGLTYTTDATTHYICDLSPLTEYKLIASGANTLDVTVISTKAGLITFNLPNNGLTSISTLKSGTPLNITTQPTIIIMKNR